MARLLAFLLLLALPAHAADQTYNVYLGGLKLGWFRYTSTPHVARISSQFTNTPLGVFDGSYEGNSRAGSDSLIYRGKSSSTNKNREVEIIRTPTGKVFKTSIKPDADRTEYSDPSTIPGGVYDPVTGFGQFLAQTGCPKPFNLYDGRRMVHITPKSADTDGPVKTCVLDYRVVLGKGHLSPLYIKHITVTVTFDPAIAKAGPSLLTLRSGLFGVEFQRD